MEEAQRELLSDVRYNVVRNMDCSTLLLTKLLQDGLITGTEIENIVSKITNTDKCASLIEYLLTRKDAFLKLYEALVEQKQSGAYIAILMAAKHKLPTDYQQMTKINNKHQLSTDNTYFHNPPANTREFLCSDDIKIFIITTNTRELTSKKITDTVLNVFVKTKTFSRAQPGMITLWTDTIPIEKLLKKLLLSSDKQKHIIVTDHTSEMTREQVNCLRERENVLISTDTIAWKDLTEDFQTKIISHKVQLVNNLLTLEELLDKYEMDEDLLENLDEHFLIQLMKNEIPQIFRNTIPAKPKYYVTREIESRAMLSLRKINKQDNEVKNDQKDYEKDKNEDIFLFSGMEQTEMTLYFTKMTNTASSQILQRAVTVQFILLESESQFPIICNLTTHPVHWIHRVDKHLNKFMWIKSRGDMSSIQKMIDPNIHEPIPEFDFYSKVFCSQHITDFDSPVCIVDSPGMGKTELLANIGRSLECSFPDQLVVFVRAQDFTSKVKEKLSIGQEMTDDILFECIQKTVCSSSLFSKELFLGCVAKNLKIDLLLDGYDEVPIANTKLAEKILKRLSNSEVNVRIFVSSRGHYLKELEEALNVLAYKILPFSKEDQHQFLVSYWTHAFANNILFSIDSNRLNQFTSLCLQNVQDQITQSDREFAGIALHCLLIGIVYQKSALEYAKSGNHFTEWVSNICVNSVSDLFEKCIETKFQDSVQKHQIEDFDKNECIYAHACHAIKLIFPDFVLNLPTNAKELFKFGILEQTASEAHQFLHKRFAEYLVSWVAVAQLQTHTHKYIDEDSANLLLQQLLETSENLANLFFYRFEQVTFDFVNWMSLYFINQKCGELRIGAEDSTIKIKGVAFNHCIRHMALACATRDFQHILNMFLITKHDQICQPQFVESLLVASVYHARLTLINFVCEYFEKMMCNSDIKYELRHVTIEIETDSYDIVSMSLLHVAVEQGKYDVVEYLCKEKGFAKLIENKRLRRLTNILSKRTLDDDDKKIQEKLKILEYLSNVNSDILTERDENNLLVFSYDTSPAIIRHLFNLMRQYSHVVSPALSTYVLLTDEDIEKFLILSACRKSSNNNYEENLKTFLLNLLTANVILSDKILETASKFMNLSTLFYMKTRDSVRAYQRLSETTDVKYLETLQGHGVNFTIVCDMGQNLLHMLPTKASVEFLRFLFATGVSVSLENTDGNIPLHNILAQNQCNASIIEIIIETLLLNGENKAELWNSLLETAATHGNSLVVTILLEKVSHIIKDYSRPLYAAMIDLKHDTAKQNQIVENLLQYGAGINYLTQDVSLQQKVNSGALNITFPILERFVSSGFEISAAVATKTLTLSIKDQARYDSKYNNRLVRYLRQLGADINMSDSDGNTLLHTATKVGQLDYVRILIDNGVSPNCKNLCQQTPLHLNTLDKSSKLSTLELLVARGGDLCAKDAKNRIALFQQIIGEKNLSRPFIKLLLAAIPNLNFRLVPAKKMCVLRKLMMKAINLGLDASENLLEAKNAIFLHACACKNCCCTKKVEVFLTKNPPSLNFQDIKGNTPLHSVFLNNSTNLGLIKSLVNAGADVKIRNKLGHDPIECFNFEDKSCSYIETFKFLGIEMKHVPDVIVQNCLEMIQSNKSSTGLNFLSTLAAEGIDVLANVEPDFIIECARLNSLSLVRFVHSLGCDFTITDLEYNSILHYDLLDFKTFETFHYLLDYAVTTGNGELLAAKNFENKTPLQSAVTKIDLLECGLDLFKRININFNVEDDNQLPLIGTTIIHGRSRAFIELLQKHGFSIDPLTNGKWKHWGHEMVKDFEKVNLQPLVDIGYNVNTADECGNTLLHTVIMKTPKKLSKAVDLLLENSANVYAKNNAGLTPFDLIAVKIKRFFGYHKPNVCVLRAPLRDTIPNENPTVFADVECNSCITKPIKRLLYKCLMCKDYNLCYNCFNPGLHSNHILAVVQSKRQYNTLDTFHQLHSSIIAVAWKYFQSELPAYQPEKTSWEMSCSSCNMKKNVQSLYLCCRCGDNQCESCWELTKNVHLNAVVFNSTQYDTFLKIIRGVKE